MSVRLGEKERYILIDNKIDRQIDRWINRQREREREGERETLYYKDILQRVL